MHGQVIGVATLQITGGQSVNFAIPSERIAQLDHSAIENSQQQSLGELVAASSRNKRAKAVEYFSLLRNMTADGFFTSKIGIKYLGYKGNTYLTSFPGCPPVPGV